MLFPLEPRSNALKNDRLSVYNFQPLDLLHPGISKNLKECKVGYIVATEYDIICGTKKNAKERAFSKFLRLNTFNSLFFFYWKMFFFHDFNPFSTAQNSLHLDSSFTGTPAKVMLKGKYNSAVATAFPYVAAYLDRVTGCTDMPVLTIIYSLISDNVNQLLHWNSTFDKKGVAKSVTRDIMQQLESLWSDLFKDLPDINIFTLMFHVLDHNVEDVSRFENHHFLDTSPFKHFKYIIKSFIRKTFTNASARGRRL